MGNVAHLGKFIKKARECLSKDLIWKLYMDIGLNMHDHLISEDIAADTATVKHFLLLALDAAPTGLKWKVLWSIAKTELQAGRG